MQCVYSVGAWQHDKVLAVRVQCMHAHGHTHMYTYAYMHMHMHMHMRMHMHMHMRMHMLPCMYAYVQVFGERGYHARSAIGTNTLPLGIAVEVEAIIKVRPL
jgi:enamine deaminase RidA (YjgF/YER057c/UK114 family)